MLGWMRRAELCSSLFMMTTSNSESGTRRDQLMHHRSLFQVAYFGALVMYNYSFILRHDIPQCIDESCIICIKVSAWITRKIAVVFPGVVQDFDAHEGAVPSGFVSIQGSHPR